MEPAVEYKARFTEADDDDIEQIARQAEELSERFAERPGIRDIFLNVRYSAVVALGDDRWRRGFGGGEVPIDYTGPPSHTIDDVGVAMAHVMALIDDVTTRAGGRTWWNHFLRELGADVRARQAQREANT